MSSEPEEPEEFKDLTDDVLLGLYHEFNTTRIDYNTIKWRTVRFFTYLNATFLTVTVALLAYKNGNLSSYTRWVLFILPISVTFISGLGYINFKRESRRLWEQEASMFKIEKYLGFHIEIPKNRCWLKGDPYLVPSRNYDTVCQPTDSKGERELSNREEWKNLDEWLDFRWQKHKLRPIIFCVFCVEACVALALVFMIIIT